jgi:hypothetical protein
MELSSNSGCKTPYVKTNMKTKTRRNANPPVATRRSVSFLGFTQDMAASGLRMIQNCPVIELKVLVKRTGEVEVTGNKLAIV